MQNHNTKQEIIFKGPGIYKSKILKFQKYIEKNHPIHFINEFCNLEGPKKIIVIHKLLKFAADFEPPPFNKIFVDFRNSINYIFLCIAHEYAHILLRYNKQIPYPFEQSLAILLQLTYEDSAHIRKFKKNTAKELMRYMKVFPEGEILLKKWSLYKKYKYKNQTILDWLNSVLLKNK